MDTCCAQVYQDRFSPFRRAPTPGSNLVRPFAPLSPPPPAHQQLPQVPKSQHVAPYHVVEKLNILDQREDYSGNQPGSRERSLSLAVDHAKALAAALEADDISCSALSVDMLGSYAAATAVLNPLGKAFGYSFTGIGKHLAQQSGGIAVEVSGPADLGRGLSEVTSAYASRYILGFQPGDRSGFHKLELQLVDKSHKSLTISTRRGFRS